MRRYIGRGGAEIISSKLEIVILNSFIQLPKLEDFAIVLSPYLFILCAEVLSHCLTCAGLQKTIQGLKISNNSPTINHLLSADDSLFFTLANIRSTKAIQKVLRAYETYSGQTVNLQKSAITFGKNVNANMKTRIRNLFNIHNDGGNGKYLGVPEQFGTKKVELFRYIVQKVKERTNGWSKKFLSQGGKEVLLKSIAMVMPIYSMQVFKLPKTICKEINNVLATYWWNSTAERKGMHWMKWDRLCKSKERRGLGFRDIEKFNDALLGKQLWRLLQFPDSLVDRTLQGRYFKDSNPLVSTLLAKSSYVWRSLLHGKHVLQSGIRCLVRNGRSIDLWQDPWLPLTPPRPPKPKNNVVTSSRVCELFAANGGWDVDKIHNLISDDDALIIRSINLTRSHQPDLLVGIIQSRVTTQLSQLILSRMRILLKPATYKYSAAETVDMAIKD